MSAVHPSPEDLVLFVHEDDPSVRTHLESCAACAEEVAVLRRLFGHLDALPVPERGTTYGAEAAERVLASIGEAKVLPYRRRFGPVIQQLALAASLAAALAVAFLAGRISRPDAPPQALSEAARERMLLVAVAGHLEKSTAMLVEVAHAEDGASLARERARAETLLPANRLYRLAAERAGDAATAQLLDEMERTLLLVATSEEGEQGLESL
ncbi:MAG: hypothetical protein JNK60_11825, partial [Acidobacteria bacterium]|nr:hypothetical protein [Acidobacteriota bacterium]